MLQTIVFIVLLTLVTGAGGLALGGVLAALLKRESKKLTSLLISFTAGLMLCIVSLDMLPEAMRPAYEPLLQETDPELKRLVKAADKMSAYIKCIEERRAGNDEFLQAEQKSLQALRGYGLPEADYFIDHFIPAFERTLDELGTMDYNEP